ncbi:unnamed protein product [Effrenium voratum]|uniref:Uncharacterized protein n=1 Tax=Effrenium voratum TaxID=2562239 RepID=A0AA36HLE8_9DINO|nr:unnamed protein product [Effrenium voratum]CAJ1438946.1 unnamed protein product [Effrenium voratum]
MYGAPWEAQVPWRPEPCPVRKGPGFLPAWQELQLQLRSLPGKPVLSNLGSYAKTRTRSRGTQNVASGGGAGTGGLVFPGQLTDEKEKRRRQQQEMQNALAEQIRELRG